MIVIFYIVDLLLSSYFIWKFRSLGATTMAVTNMIVTTSIAGSTPVSIFGFESNFGNFPFAIVMYCLTCAAVLNNHKAYMSLVTMVLGAFTIRALAGCVVGDDVLFNFRILMGSFMAFFFSSMVNFLILNAGKYSLWKRKILANVLAQAFDSLIFFSIAFQNVMSEFMAVGFVVKALLNVIDTPLFFLCVKDSISQAKFDKFEHEERQYEGYGHGA